jgi:hypothetical protein
MGRRSEALERYEQLRRDLRAAYGTDPDPETRRLYRDLLTGSLEVEEPPDVRRHNLVPALTSFVGREREMADVRRLLSRGRLLTLTGVGGAARHGSRKRWLAGSSTRTPMGCGSRISYRWPSRAWSPTP